MNNNRFTSILIISFIVGDLIFSFLQYYQTPLYGDLSNGILPGNDVMQVLNDPFGFNAIKTGEAHVNPNRYFSHFFLMKYFQNVPLFLQNFFPPIVSVYLCCALLKLFVQILFIYCLSAFISGEFKCSKNKFVLSAVIIIPLFQAYGYWSRMGINDKSIAYTFFYGLPLVLLMLFLLHVFNGLKNQTKFKPLNSLFFFPFVIILPFSGPLIPAVLVLSTALVFIKYWISASDTLIVRTMAVWSKIPGQVYILLFPAALCSLYALFLGKYDSNYLSATIPITERYARLPYGIYKQIFHALGFPLMLIIIGINTYILKKKPGNHEGDKLISTLKWIGYFSVIYILLLPLGGYRPYREYIIRYDTIMPVTTVLIYFFGVSTYFLINHLQGKTKIRYLAMIITVLLIFTFADFKGLNRNKCEKEALVRMAVSEKNIVAIPKDCFVMEWDNIVDSKRSDKNASLIHFWGITNEKKLYYNEN